MGVSAKLGTPEELDADARQHLAMTNWDWIVLLLAVVIAFFTALLIVVASAFSAGWEKKPVYVLLPKKMLSVASQPSVLSILAGEM